MVRKSQKSADTMLSNDGADEEPTEILNTPPIPIPEAENSSTVTTAQEEKPLQATSPMPRRRRRKTVQEKEQERRAANEAQLVAARRCCDLLISVATPLVAHYLPPPFDLEEKRILVEAWTPVMAEYGDIPPATAAIIVTLGVLGPRLLSRYGQADSNSRPLTQRQNLPSAPADE